jgi:hypothetical protein
MKKIFLIGTALTLLVFTNCKKKHNDPAPVVTTTPTNGGTNGGTSSATTSGSLTIGTGTATPLSIITFSQGGVYGLSGVINNTQTSITADFFNGKPTASSTEDLSNSTKIALLYNSNNVSYSPHAGTVNVTVNGTALTVSFTNLVFTDGNGNNITLSSTMYTSK